MPKLEATTAAFAHVIDKLGTDLLIPTLADILCQFAEADDVTVIVYGPEEMPTVSFAQPLKGNYESTLSTYLTGPFLLDPFYRAAAYDKRFGAFRLADLAPSSFRTSEYYKNWYKTCGYQDECGLLIKLSEDNFLNISIGLTGEGARFKKKHARALSDVYEITSALCRKHFHDIRKASTPTMRERMHRSLAAFGASMLTKRERQTVELVLLGHNTRLIAEKLGISIETVKLHRKHAYAKLDISSQAELFFLFMEALSHWSGDPDTDPLIAYMGSS